MPVEGNTALITQEALEIVEVTSLTLIELSKNGAEVFILLQPLVTVSGAQQVHVNVSSFI